MRYTTENMEVVVQPEGYLEVVVNEHRSMSWPEYQKVAEVLRAHGIFEVRVLLTRIHQYAPPRDYLLHDMSVEPGVRILKVAYFSPIPTGQNLSHAVGETSFRNVPHRIFAEREPALAWLLAD